MVINQKLIKMSCCNNFTRLHNYYSTFPFHTVSYQIIKNAVWVLVNKYHISAIVVNQSKDPRNLWLKYKVVPSSIVHKNKLCFRHKRNRWMFTAHHIGQAYNKKHHFWYLLSRSKKPIKLFTKYHQASPLISSCEFSETSFLLFLLTWAALNFLRLTLGILTVVNIKSQYCGLR